MAAHHYNLIFKDTSLSPPPQTSEETFKSLATIGLLFGRVDTSLENEPITRESLDEFRRSKVLKGDEDHILDYLLSSAEGSLSTDTVEGKLMEKLVSWSIIRSLKSSSSSVDYVLNTAGLLPASGGFTLPQTLMDGHVQAKGAKGPLHLKLSQMTPDLLYTSTNRQARPDIVIPLARASSS